jgi:hypothetical protein
MSVRRLLDQRKVGELVVVFLHNFLSFNHYFRKYFKLVIRTTVVMVPLTTGIIFLLFACMQFWVG